MKILLVDDNKETRRATLRLLQDNRNDVVTAYNKIQGLGYLRRWQPELIIIGLWIDTITDNLDFIVKAKQIHSQTRFWLLWSDTDWKITSLAKESGAERVISKSDLLQALKDAAIISSN
jgi:CheY-like chemotaxis protein